MGVIAYLNGGWVSRYLYEFLGNNRARFAAKSWISMLHVYRLKYYGRATMISISSSGVRLILCAVILGVAVSTQAAVSIVGDVTPSSVSNWNGTTDAHIGISNGQFGSVSINGGSDLFSAYSYMGYGFGSTGTVTISGSGSTWTSEYNTYVGYEGNATLNITSGGVFNSPVRGVDIAKQAGSSGIVNVSGSGSAFNVNSVNVGAEGNAEVTISAGGTANTGALYIANGVGSNGKVTVDGSGSKWTITEGNLYVGLWGEQGVLEISNGGQVHMVDPYGFSDKLTNIAAGSMIDIEISDDNMLQLDHDVYQNGTIRLSARAGLTPGVYTPITQDSGNWFLSNGTFEVYDGIWDFAARTYTINASTMGMVSKQTTIDLSTNQHIDVGTKLQVDFTPTTSSEYVDFSATTTTGQPLVDLQTLLGPDETLEESWDFEVSGLPSGDDVLLSFAVSGQPATGEINIWHYEDGSGWSPYTPGDLVVSDGWASFSVDSFSSYALTVVPEPASMSLLVLGGMALAIRKRSATST
jgi:T5SS/PEP-CTERM-associated repeat protein